MNSTIIELNNVHKTYFLGETQIAAVKDVNLCIRREEFVAIWGPSGSGKSTLCNLIGLLDVPDQGDVLINGQNVHQLSDDQRSDLRNQSIGFIFQSFNLVPVLSALENVMLPLEIRGTLDSGAKKKAIALLTRLGLGGHLAHRPQKLSGGQQQRVAIARAFVTDPSVIIADEPTANLDTGTAMTIIQLMRDLNQESGVTFLLSTHDQRLLNQVNRKVLLQDGVIVEDKHVLHDTIQVDAV